MHKSRSVKDDIIAKPSQRTCCRDQVMDDSVIHARIFLSKHLCVLSVMAGESSSKSAAQPLRRNEENLIMWFCKNIALHCH